MDKKKILQCMKLCTKSYEHLNTLTFEAPFKLMAIFDVKKTDTQGFIVFDVENNEVFVIFRGTKGFEDVVTDLTIQTNKLFVKDSSDKFIETEVHSGFLQSYMSVENEIFEFLYKNVTNQRIYFCGHSLGGALATIAGVRLMEFGSNVITFGCPKVGNSAFCKVYNDNVRESIRVMNQDDVVPGLPPLFSYSHVDTKVHLDTNGKKLGYFNIFLRLIQSLFSKNKKFGRDHHAMRSYENTLEKWTLNDE